MLNRLDTIIQSAETYLDDQLQLLGLVSPTNYELLDAYPSSISDPLSHVLIVTSVAHRDPQIPMECGGPLVSQRNRIMIDVFAPTEALSQNIVGWITEKFFAINQQIPYYDFTTTPPTQIDSVRVDNVLSSRNYFTNALPWQEHFHSVVVSLVDEFNAPLS